MFSSYSYSVNFALILLFARWCTLLIRLITSLFTNRLSDSKKTRKRHNTTIGVADEGAEGARAPPPPLKFGKIFFGQLLCKIRAFFGQKSCKI